jgi:uncharacterized protein YggU (UPF0235/DUF167 family)
MTTIAVRVRPRASRARQDWDGKTLALWVVEPAVGGQANAAVIGVIARWLGVPRGEVTIRSGPFARTKLVEVAGDVTLPRPVFDSGSHGEH